MKKGILVFLICFALVTSLLPFKAHAVVQSLQFTDVISNPDVVYSNAVVAQNNDIYVLYNDRTSGIRRYRIVKYNYASGTWGSPIDLKIGGSTVYYNNNIRDNFTYKDGTFYLLYEGGFTQSTDPYNFPAATVLPVPGYVNTHINVRNDGRVAIYMVSGTYTGTAIMYSNYSGSFQTYTFGQFASSTYVSGVLFNNDNSVTVWREYSPGGDGSYTGRLYTDYHSWNGSVWTGAPSTDFISGGDYSGTIYPYDKYKGASNLSGYTDYEKIGSQLFSVSKPNSSTSGSVRSESSTTGNFSVSTSGSVKPSIKKFNNPDGRLIAFYNYYGIKAAITDYFWPQELSVNNKTVNSITVNYTNDNNSRYTATTVTASRNSNMSSPDNSITTQNEYSQATVHSKEFTGLLPSTRYYFRAEIVDNLGRSKQSSIINTYTLPAIPGTPSITNAGASFLTIVWGENQNGTGTTYSLERSLTGNPSGTDWQEVYRGINTTFTNSGLPENTTYYYRVRAKNIDNQWSSYTSVSTFQTLDGPNIPTISSPVSGGSHDTSVTLTASSTAVGATVTYSWEYSLDNSIWNPIISTTSGTYVWTIPVEVPLNSSVYVRVSATANGAVSSFSSPIRFNKAVDPIIATRLAAESADQSAQAAKDAAEFVKSTTESIQTAVQDNNSKIDTISQEIVEMRDLLNSDITPPSVGINWQSNKTVTNNSSENLYINVKDNISTEFQYQILRDGTELDTWTTLPVGAIVSVDINNGLNIYEVYVKDEANNIAIKNINIWRM